MKNPIKILVVDDSAVIRDFLVYILSSQPDMHVVGTAKNGKEAILLAERKKPDVITMDINMPLMNGFEATRQIMSLSPTPIVIVTSSFERADVDKTFEAIEAGALAILAKPVGFKHPNYKEASGELIQTVRTMSEVKVITRRNNHRKTSASIPTHTPVEFDEKKTRYRLTAIGVSTGGPQVLSQMLPLFPANYNMPIVIVQHIPEGFLEGMVEWLAKNCRLKLKIAENGDQLEKGNIYFCPPNFNIGIEKNLQVSLKDEVPGYSIKPSVSYMFRTISKNIVHKAVGVLLTGMGRDGAEELALLKEAGSVTIVQNEESSVVFGMPGEAIKLDAHKYILAPVHIVEKLIELDQNGN